MKLFQSLHFVSKHLAVSSEANEILGMAGLPKAEGWCHLESIKAIGSCNDQDMYTGQMFLTPFVFAFAFLSFLQNSTELVRNDWVPQTVKCCTVLTCLDNGFSMCITANSNNITASRAQHAVNDTIEWLPQLLWESRVRCYIVLSISLVALHCLGIIHR